MITLKFNTLSFRLLFSTGLVMAAFFILALLVLERGFRNSAEQTLKEKLQIQVYALLSVAEMSPSGKLKMPQHLQESRLSNPSSGLYAVIRRSSHKLIWKSKSAIAVDVMPLTDFSAGEAVFLEDKQQRFVLHYGFIWEKKQGLPRKYVISIAEDGFFVSHQIERFRSTLRVWFFSVGLVLVLIQFTVLHWGLKPLRRIVSDLAAIEAGEKNSLDGYYPEELSGLTYNLNVFITNERAHLERYRNTLADLSHSLKTPLAILNSSVETNNLPKKVMQFQISRMNDIIEYQLQKAAAKGQKKLTGAINTHSIVKKIVTSLDKVYFDKKISFEFEVSGSQQVYCEEGDMYEIAGNLLDNSAKWCQGRIKIRLFSLNKRLTQDYSFLLQIEDDGCGIAEDKLSEILKRGVRADENIDGHGIGMAVVYELIELLGGELLGGRSDSLGGVRWQVYFP
ncbi:MAG: ATP-binding protein [Methylococcales bacterium]|nr:ATP-binding protein [Methylococcales bacterium]